MSITRGQLKKNIEVRMWRERQPKTKEEIAQLRDDADAEVLRLEAIAEQKVVGQ